MTETGHPYLVLEHVDGKPIDAYCRERNLDALACVRLFLDVLAAVAHAHANLIVHRDIKPSRRARHDRRPGEAARFRDRQAHGARRACGRNAHRRVSVR